MTALETLRQALADRYLVEHELGAGGMATVFAARDLKHERRVAIKVLHPDLGSALGGERFLAEIRTTARLQHPHILPLLDSGEAAGLLYYVMPLASGETLRQRLDRERQLPLDDAVRIAREVADALGHAHALGVIHRDIKPENILLQEGHALVADFGIALAVQQAGGPRMTQTGLSLGTPQYMSPEQAMGERAIDARSDIYALGAITYEMLTGEPPFTGATVQAIVAKVLTERPLSPRNVRDTVSPGLEGAVLKALAKLPADRHATVADFARALDAPAPPAALHAAPPARDAWRRPLAWTALFAAGALAGAWLGRTREPTTGATPRPIRLTHNGRVGCAAIAPAGDEYAAIVGDYNEETFCEGLLLVRPLPAGADVVVAQDVREVRAVRWSPDGERLLVAGVVDGVRALRVYHRRSGTVRLVREGEAPLYGFVNDTLAFVARGRTMQMLDIESGAVRDSLVVPGEGNLQEVEWAAPADRVLIATRGKWLLLDREGEPLDSLAEGSGPATWAGPARVVVAAGAAYAGDDLVAYDLDASRRRFDPSSRSVVWAGVANVDALSSTGGGDRLAVVVEQLTDEQVVFTLGSPVRTQRMVRSLGSYLGDPRISPDDARILYARRDAVGFNPYWIPLGGGREQGLASDTTGRPLVAWSGPERALAWNAATRSILDVDLPTGRLRRVAFADSTRAFHASWGDRWFWSEAGSPHMVVTDSAGGRRRRILMPARLRSARIAPGGRTAIVQVDTDSGFRLQALPVDSGDVAISPEIRVPGLELARGGDGRTNYFYRHAGTTELWRMERLDQPPTLVASLPARCFGGSVYVSSDGARVVCNVTSYDPDVWLLPQAARR